MVPPEYPPAVIVKSLHESNRAGRDSKLGSCLDGRDPGVNSHSPVTPANF